MHKRFISIILLYTSLVIILGHNFIPHHHHDNEHYVVSHHHNDGHHHHDGHHHDNDPNNEDEDWGHIFSGIHHGAHGFAFLTSHSSTENFTKQILQFPATHISNIIFRLIIKDVQQNVPPYLAEYYNYLQFLPYGLRAPPKVIV